MHQIVPGNEYSLAPEAHPVMLLHCFRVIEASEREDGKAGADLLCRARVPDGVEFQLTVDQHGRITREANRAFIEDKRGHHRHAAGHRIVPYQTTRQDIAQKKLL